MYMYVILPFCGVEEAVILCIDWVWEGGIYMYYYNIITLYVMNVHVYHMINLVELVNSMMIDPGFPRHGFSTP